MDDANAPRRSWRRRVTVLLAVALVGAAALVGYRAGPPIGHVVRLAAFSDDERAADDDDSLLGSLNISSIEVINSNGTAAVVAGRR